MSAPTGNHEVVGLPESYPSYILSKEEVAELSHDFLLSHEVPNTEFGCYVIHGADHFSNLGRAVESQVFLEEFSNHPQMMEKEYGPYETNSTFFVTFDHATRLPIGVMRIMENYGEGLKTFVDLPKTDLEISPDQICKAYDADPSKIVDLSTLAIIKDYRGLDASPYPALLLYRTLYHQIITNPQFTHMVNIIDEKAWRRLWAYRFAFERIFGSNGFPYLGSEKSIAMCAQNTRFKPQLEYWNKDLQARGDRKALKGMYMEMLVDDEENELDKMLGFEKPDYS